MSESVVEEVIVDGRVSATNRAAIEESYAGRGERVLPQSALDRLAALEREEAAPDDDDAPEGDAELIADPGEATETAEAKPDEPAAEAAAETDAPKEPVTEVAKTEEAPAVAAEIERLRAANAALVADLEQRSAPAIPERHVKLSEAADGYLDDDIGSIRRFIAHSLHVDPDSKDVDAELEHIYTTLTSKSLGVTPDAASVASRENARTRQLLAKQKRERATDEATSAEKAKAEAEASKSRNAVSFIANRLDPKSFPLLSSLASDIDGKTPAEVVWQTIQREGRAGRFDDETVKDDGKLIEAAAKIIESRYTKIAEKTRTNLSTTPSTVNASAKAPAASTSSAKIAQPPPTASSKARTLTNADASVAPAAPPAKKPPTEKPKFKSDAERRDYALRHLPK